MSVVGSSSTVAEGILRASVLLDPRVFGDAAISFFRKIIEYDAARIVKDRFTIFSNLILVAIDAFPLSVKVTLK